MPLTDTERAALVEELRYYAKHFQPAVEDDNNYYRGECSVDGKDAAALGETSSSDCWPSVMWARHLLHLPMPTCRA